MLYWMEHDMLYVGALPEAIWSRTCGAELSGSIWRMTCYAGAELSTLEHNPCFIYVGAEAAAGIERDHKSSLATWAGQRAPLVLT